VSWEVKYYLIAYFPSNISARNYHNRLTYVEVIFIAKRSSVVSLGQPRFLQRICEFAEETMRVIDDGNLTWDDVVRSQVSSGTLLAPHLPQDEHQQQKHGTRKAETDQLMPGGRSVPLWCIPRHRIAVVVPFRARDQHLTYFINHLHPFLRSQLLDFVIVVVEQVRYTCTRLAI